MRVSGVMFALTLVGFSARWSLAQVQKTPDPNVATLANEVRDKGWIVYSAKTEAGDWDLYLMRPDGSARRNVTNTPAFNEAGAKFSPDGRRLLYYRMPKSTPVDNNKYGLYELVLADADGANANVWGNAFQWASWGPGGRSLACLSIEGIDIVDVASRKVIRSLARKGIVQQLVWSPDGKWFIGTANGLGVARAIGRLNAESAQINAVGENDRCPYRFQPDSYCRYYQHTVSAILRADPNALVGGPALAWWNRMPQSDGLFDFQNNVRPAYFTFKLLSRLTGDRLRVTSSGPNVHGLAARDDRYSAYQYDVMLRQRVAFTVCLLLNCGVRETDSARAGLLPSPIDSPQAAARVDPDVRVRRYVWPSRIVWHSDNGVENPQVLLTKRTGQVTLNASNPCVLRNQAGILLDFGVELHGGVQILVWHTKGSKPVRLRVRFGESVSEAMAELGGWTNATNDHAVRDQSVLVPWLGTAEVGNTGFRFVRIDLADTDSFVQLKAIRAVFIYRDIEYKGSFQCSDERLNRIWRTGAYTVHLNMQDYLWDGIKRDRLVWIGDMHPETMSVCAVFGAGEVVPRSLDLIRDETPLPNWMNGISSYSMWWVLIHHSWYLYTGDLEYLRQQKPYLTGLLDLLARQIGPDNRETLPPHRFLDWPSSENAPAIHAGLHALLTMTLRAGAHLCEILDEPATRDKCTAAVERLTKHVPDPAGSKQAAALIALAGLDDPTKLNSQVMAVDGARRMSTFYGYYVLQARALAGDYQGALDCIRQYWGAMLDLGATTFWEDFDLDWTAGASRIDELVPSGKKDIHGDFGNYCYKGFRHSLCHGWASGPTAWLSEHVLGVEVIEPGCRVVRIDPHLADLDWAEGTFPTPMGLIKLRHEKLPDGTIRSAIDAPPGVKILHP